MKTIDRKAVHRKYEGRCAYCGKVITMKEMQVDHIIPKARGYKVPDVHSMSNLNPSCRMCNHYKRAHSLEGYRHALKTLHKRLNKIYIFRVAMDYGIVKLDRFDGRFFFEKERK